MLKLAGVVLSVLLLSGTGFLSYADAQTQKYLSYENKQYGFSIKYPSKWEKTETLSKSTVFPNVLDIVTFSTPSDITSYGVSLIKDDTTFRGLSGQKFLDKIKERFVDSLCSGAPTGVTCSTAVRQQTTLTHQNGYSGYLIIFEVKVSSDQEPPVEFGAVMGFYPDGNDVWIIGAASPSGDEFQKYTNELSTIGSSFKIFSYEGEQTTTTSQPSTVAKSSVGILQINSGNFAVTKYKPAELIVSGEVNNYLKGVPLTLKIVKPDKTTEEQNILVTKDGKFKTPIKLDENWPAGSYRILAKYGSADLGSVSFQINTGDATTSKSTTKQQTKQETTTTSQSKKYLSYENKKYGFSLKYPSTWEKEEQFKKDETYPNITSLISFQNPSYVGTFTLGFIQDDKETSQEILDKMKTEGKDAICSSMPAEATCSVEISEKRLTHKNGYGMHVTTILVKILDEQRSLEIPMTITMIPDGKNTWLITNAFFSPTDPKQLSQEAYSISESFKISNYKGSTQSSIITEQSTSTSSTQKQFSLNVKAIQENDQVTITISSPPDLASDVYGIKLTTTTGKIKNYVKVNGWDHKRINDNTVSYQTKSSPLGQSDVITIKLKVDSKKPEIKWEAYSKDQKSLGTGKMKP